MHRFRIPSVLSLTFAVGLLAPLEARSQDSCTSLRQYIAQLDRQVQSGTRSGAPSQQVNHDIALRNQQVQIYNQRCQSSGGAVMGGGGARSGGLGAAIQVLGILAPLIDAAARASEAERQRQAQAERERLLEELEWQRAALAEIERLESQARAAGEASVRQQAQAQQDADRVWRQSQTNPFAAPTPPNHEIRTFPRQKIETTLVDAKSPNVPSPLRCSSDTPGTAPGGQSLSPECMGPRAPVAPSGRTETPTRMQAPPAHGPASEVAQRTPAAGDGAIANVEVTNPGGTLMRPRTQEVRRANSREQPGGALAKAPFGTEAGREIESAVGNPAHQLRSGSGAGRVREESDCIVVGGFTEQVAGPNGSTGYFTAANRCPYRVVAAFCFRRLSGGETCGPLGGEPNWSERSVFAYADASGNRITYTMFACRADSRDPAAEQNACVDAVRSITHARDDGKRP